MLSILLLCSMQQCPPESSTLLILKYLQLDFPENYDPNKCTEYCTSYLQGNLNRYLNEYLAHQAEGRPSPLEAYLDFVTPETEGAVRENFDAYMCVKQDYLPSPERLVPPGSKTKVVPFRRREPNVLLSSRERDPSGAKTQVMVGGSSGWVRPPSFSVIHLKYPS